MACTFFSSVYSLTVLKSKLSSRVLCGLGGNFVKVVHCAVRVKGCRFKDLFLRVKTKKGSQIVYVAVAHKMLTVA